MKIYERDRIFEDVKTREVDLAGKPWLAV